MDPDEEDAGFFVAKGNRIADVAAAVIQRAGNPGQDSRPVRALHRKNKVSIGILHLADAPLRSH